MALVVTHLADKSALARLSHEESGVWDRALDVQRRLAARSMTRAVGIRDLLVAATAEVAGVTLLHYDADFEHVAAITGQPVEWVVPRGTVP